MRWTKRILPPLETTDERTLHQAYGMFSGGLGILLNLVLFGIKLPIGLLTGSISVVSDAFNNMTDMGSSVVTYVCTRTAARRPDKEHPFGHGRMEYVASLIISFLIMVVAVELFKGSFEKILAPQAVRFEAKWLALLLLSVLVKLGMYFMNRTLGKRIHSKVLLATATDSRNDVVSTSLATVLAFFAQYTTFPLDGVGGLAMSLWILWSGFGIARDTISVLLGGRPDPQLVKQLSQMVLEGDGIVGLHDLVVHDYGPGRTMASAHAEVPADIDIVKLHESIDDTEQRILKEMGVPIVIHADPILVDCERTKAIREQVEAEVAKLVPSCSMHDFRLTDGENRINLIFDLVVPVETAPKVRASLQEQLRSALKQVNPAYRCVIRVDDSY